MDTETAGRPSKTVCVIGGGVTGLTTAYRLGKAGFTVAVIEQNPEAGGMLSSFFTGGSRLEHIYHHIFTSDTHVRSLADELGLGDQIEWFHPRDALLSGGRLYPFTGPLDLLRFRAIPFLDRIRTGLLVLRAGRLRHFAALEEQTAADWLRRQGGRRAYETLWKPLLRAKFDTDAEEVSAVWIWNKFKLRGGSRKGGKGKETLGYMRGSFGRMVDRLVEEIVAGGGNVLTRTTALDISKREKGGYAVTCILEDCSARTLPCDAVVACIAGRQFSNIASALRLPPDYLDKVSSVSHKANLCVVLRLKDPLTDSYWTTICDTLPFVVMVEHTNLTGPEPYRGAVVYLSRYLGTTDPLWTRTDDNIYRLFCGELARILPSFSFSQVVEWRVRRTRYAQPVVLRNYGQRLTGIDTPDPGVKLAGMAQIYPQDRGVNYAIALAGQAASSVEAYLEEKPES